MKITKLLSLLFLSLVFLSNGCNEDENLEIEQNCDAPKCYITSIRTVNDTSDYGTIWEYEIINGEKRLEKFMQTNIEHYTDVLYDNNNRYIGTKSYYENVLSYERIVTYNDNGQKTNITGINYQHNNNKDEIIFEYDLEGRLSKREEYYRGRYQGEFVVQEYNSFNQPILGLRRDRNRNLIETIKYDYNDCISIETTRYISDNISEINRNEEREYLFLGCESGCPISKITLSYEDGRSPNVVIFEYNDRGLIDSYYTTYDGNRIWFTSYFEYECD